MLVTLPWPPPGLSPNARSHWATKARLVKKYREVCAWQAKAQGIKPTQHERLKVHLTFVPPNRRARDWDNLIASMKAGLDGLSDVLCLDDSRFVLSFELLENEIGGMVRVSIDPITSMKGTEA